MAVFIPPLPFPCLTHLAHVKTSIHHFFVLVPQTAQASLPRARSRANHMHNQAPAHTHNPGACVTKQPLPHRDWSRQCLISQQKLQSTNHLWGWRNSPVRRMCTSSFAWSHRPHSVYVTGNDKGRSVLCDWWSGDVKCRARRA